MLVACSSVAPACNPCHPPRGGVAQWTVMGTQKFGIIRTKFESGPFISLADYDLRKNA